MGDEQELYEYILRTANKFLTHAKKFEISVLQGYNPTFSELAEIIHQIADMVYTLVHDKDPHMAQKATDYAYIMRNMALAITNSDEKKMSDLITELDNKPFL